MRLTQTDELQIRIYDILRFHNLDNVNNDLPNDMVFLIKIAYQECS